MAGKITTALEKSGIGDGLENRLAYNDRAKTGRSSHKSLTEEVHLSEYFEVLKRHKWVVLSVCLLVVVTVTFFSLIAAPTYSSTAQILLGDQPTPTNPLGENSGRISEKALMYSTQVNLLNSRTLISSVIEALQLQKWYPSETRKWRFQKLKNGDPRNETAETNNSTISEENDPELNKSRLINWYLENLNVEQIRDSSLVNISFSGKNPELVTRIVNAHAEAAINNAVKFHQSKAEEALDWMRKQITDQKNEVEATQRAIYEFKKKYNVLSITDSNSAVSQEVKEINTELTKAKSERIAKQALYYQLKEINDAQGNILLIPEISNYKVIEGLRSKLVELKSEQLEMSTRYGPMHPKMVKLEVGIDKINVEIQKESHRLQNVIKADLERAIDVENKINEALEEQKRVALSQGERGIEYEVLKQQAESQQYIYNFLLKQAEEIGLSSAISSSNMRIIDKAEVPVKPIRPKVMLNILGAMIFSLLAGSGLAFFLEYLDNSVKSPIDVAVRLGLPVLGMIPIQKSDSGKDWNQLNRISDSSNTKLLDTPIYHISNRLPAELRSPADGLLGKVLIVESVTMGEGKTSVIAKIAMNLTDAGLRVLLVDCDFQRPALNKLFNLPSNGGLGKAINKIMSHQLSAGTLKEYSVDDLFFMIALKKKSGHLTIRNDDQTYIAHFHNGTLIHFQNQNNQSSNRIGTMLIKGGHISEDQLDDALQRHRRTGQPIGYILVNAGYIGREKLRGPLRLQIEEHIQKVFSWRKGNFVFTPGFISPYSNEKILFEEDYTPFISSLSRMETSNFIENELFKNISSLKIENLFLMPAGTSYKLIGSLNQVLMKKVFEKLKHHFDVVLIDTPPLDSASGIESIFPLTDGIVLVIKAGHLSVKMLNGAINHLPEDKIVGAVLNQVKIDKQPYYYL